MQNYVIFGIGGFISRENIRQLAELLAKEGFAPEGSKERSSDKNEKHILNAIKKGFNPRFYNDKAELNDFYELDSLEVWLQNNNIPYDRIVSEMCETHVFNYRPELKQTRNITLDSDGEVIVYEHELFKWRDWLRTNDIQYVINEINALLEEPELPLVTNKLK